MHTHTYRHIYTYRHTICIYVVASLQDGTQSLSPDVNTLCSLYPYALNRTDLCTNRIFQNDGEWLLRLGHKYHGGLHIAPTDISHFEGSQPPYHKDTQAALWRVSCGREVRPPANSPHQPASPVNEPSWKWTLQPNSGLRL